MLEKRIVFVTGKGGVGKSTVAAALAVAAARRGLRTIVAELSGQHRIPERFGYRGPPVAELELSERLTWISIEPRAALNEYLRLRAGVFGAALGASPWFGPLASATPGLSELVTLGKAWELARPARGRGAAPSHDLVIVDAPSSGHCVALLRSPATFAQIARGGPVARQARAIASTLSDLRTTGVLIVALAEEMAVSETLLLRDELVRECAVGVLGVLVNRIYPRRFDDRDAERLSDALGSTRGRPARTALRAALSQRARRQRQEAQLERLAQGIGERAGELPLLAAGPLDRAALELLGELVAGAP